MPFVDLIFVMVHLNYNFFFYKAGIEIFEDGPTKNVSTGLPTKDET